MCPDDDGVAVSGDGHAENDLPEPSEPEGRDV
jgi:hypothetical protein